MQLLLMLKLNIKHTYTVIEGLHKTSHQMADLVCIIDMLMYLVFCFFIYIYIYILSHSRDTDTTVDGKTHDVLCTVHCSSSSRTR